MLTSHLLSYMPIPTPTRALELHKPALIMTEKRPFATIFGLLNRRCWLIRQKAVRKCHSPLLLCSADFVTIVI
jgi:hypothetical protein